MTYRIFFKVNTRCWDPDYVADKIQSTPIPHPTLHPTPPHLPHGKAPASGTGGLGFKPRPRHNNGVKMVLGVPLADALIIKGSSRKINERT